MGNVGVCANSQYQAFPSARRPGVEANGSWLSALHVDKIKACWEFVD